MQASQSGPNAMAAVAQAVKISWEILLILSVYYYSLILSRNLEPVFGEWIPAGPLFYGHSLQNYKIFRYI